MNTKQIVARPSLGVVSKLSSKSSAASNMFRTPRSRLVSIAQEAGWLDYQTQDVGTRFVVDDIVRLCVQSHIARYPATVGQTSTGIVWWVEFTVLRVVRVWRVLLLPSSAESECLEFWTFSEELSGNAL